MSEISETKSRVAKHTPEEAAAQPLLQRPYVLESSMMESQMRSVLAEVQESRHQLQSQMEGLRERDEDLAKTERGLLAFFDGLASPAGV